MSAPSGHSVQTRDAPESPTVVNEPSMEDILASIRRIIAADQTGAPIRNGFVPPKVEEGSKDLAPPVESAPRSADGDLAAADPGMSAPPVSIEGVVRQGWNDAVDPARFDSHELPEALPMAESGHDAMPQAASEEPGFDRHERAEARDSLYPTDADAADAMEEVHESDLVDASGNAETLISPAAGASISSSFQALAQSLIFNDPEMIERVARDALRPMLKAWLDENLPSMVERLVRSEIERVARGGRSRD